ncbi:MAG TPA: ATP-dependent DNA ligase [Kofleriaceae bacterium]|nr:ATP-dependent DNA ligase [Kofleriaceae bacterium]
MQLSELVATSAAVASTRSRNAKLERLGACLRALAPDERRAGAMYLAGELPQGRIGIGWALIQAAFEGAPPSVSASLSIGDVDRTLTEIAGLGGAGSGRARKERLGALFAKMTDDERKFAGALIVGNLLQGALAGLVTEAIARASGLASAVVRRAVMVAGNVGVVADAALSSGDLSRFAITVGKPIAPMLAQTAEDIGAAMEELHEAALEHKLDGARVQIHKDGDLVRVFSRAGNDVTVAVPEVVAIARALPARTLILDGEAIALRPDRRPHPFQITMRRFGRSIDDEDLRASLPLEVFAFDALLIDDEVQVDRATRDRHAALQAIVPDVHRVPRIVTADPSLAKQFADAAFAAGHEGVMAKALDAPYDAGNRGAAWLKIKKVHTLDLVVIGVEWGSGRRTGTLSNIHLGARDPHNGGFVMLGKTFKGMTDELLAWQTRELLAREIGRDGHVVYVRPELVVEIAFNDVQASPHYPGGLALRFARVLRYRPDKQASEADTIDAVRAIAIADGVITS